MPNYRNDILRVTELLWIREDQNRTNGRYWKTPSLNCGLKVARKEEVVVVEEKVKEDVEEHEEEKEEVVEEELCSRTLCRTLIVFIYFIHN